MSQVRVHNFSISLDGFGTGDGITFDAPFGHAGERLHEWMFATRFWRSMVGEAGGTEGVDHSYAERHGLGIGAEIMGRGKFGPQTGPWTDVGTDDEWRGWWARTHRSTRRCSCSRTTRARRSRWTAGPRSTSSSRGLERSGVVALVLEGHLHLRAVRRDGAVVDHHVELGDLRDAQVAQRQ